MVGRATAEIRQCAQETHLYRDKDVVYPVSFAMFAGTIPTMPISAAKNGITGMLLMPLILVLPTAAQTENTDTPRVFENKQLRLRLIARTPQQMAAFYEGRGFPPLALKEITQTCFITVSLRNKSGNILWLEPATWEFTSSKGKLSRLDRKHWQQRWQAIELAQAQRATFGWTLLPERRDLRPDEPVGGNIVLPRTSTPFDIAMKFRAVSGDRETLHTIRLKHVVCAQDKS